MNVHMPPPAADEGHVTPSMAQFLEIKDRHRDSILFYRMGDFYELFFEDAEVASRILGIVLTRRGKHRGADIPMCGVPVVRSEEYLQRLIASGLRVAVCEQMEDPAEARKRGSKAVVRRDVVRLVTPGTVTEEGILDPTRSNLFLAVARHRAPDGTRRYGLAAIDISTGRFTVCEVPEGAFLAEVARLDPREVVLLEDLHEDPDLRRHWAEARHAVTPVSRSGLDADSAERRLREHYGVATLDAFGAFGPAETLAAAVGLAYVERTQIAARPRLSPPSRGGDGDTLLVDAATRANLELGRTLSGRREGSLLDTVDRTVTPPGARLLAERMAGPLTDLAAVAGRHDAVEWLAGWARRDTLRSALRGVPDVMRAVSRLALARGGPRDLACVRDAIRGAAAVASVIGADATGEVAPRVADLADPSLAPLADHLAATLADDLPLSRRDGGFVREGAVEELDRTRSLSRDSRQVIAELQGRYASETGCRTLRIKNTAQFGYFVEVPAAFGEEILRGPWKATFTHRQTMAGAMRFTTTELAELDARIAGAGEEAVAIEAGVFDDLVGAVLERHARIARMAESLAVVDVAAGLAHAAVECRWTRPEMTAGLDFLVEGGRHPVVEAAVRSTGTPFIPNGCDLSGTDAGRVLLVTGPNMGGKSTYLRQNALVVVLAQMGSFVPASRARIGVVDRLFSRVGAADDLARGRSTFMVEMVETAAILNQATARSLVILDEIGRGTATNDGLSIAWASVEHLHARNRCRSLFATHFHELTELAKRLARVSNATLKVSEWEGDVVFLHEVVPGVADRSYGLQVAKLAGLPAEVIDRAGAVMAELEKADRPDRRKGRRQAEPELPLFAAAPQAPPPRLDPVRAAVRGYDPDAMTPRQALEALYALRALADG